MNQKPQAPQHHPLKTRHVFLDTEVYRQLGHNPDTAPLRELGEKVSADQLILHTTDITLAEIRRQLTEFVTESANSVKAARKSAGRWLNRHPDLVTEIPELNVEMVSAAAFQKIYQAIRVAWNATYHEATSMSALSVFKDYFSGQPPFSQAKSKEFPDAFVIKALEIWCKEQEERIYVVSADKAMREAARATGVLVPVESLKDLLAAAAVVTTPDIIRQAADLLKKKPVVAELQSAIEASIDDLVPIYGGDMADGEVTGHSVSGSIEIISYGVIAATAKDLSVLMDVRIPLSIELSYEDRSDALYDSEDDVYFGAETDQAEFEDESIIRVFAKLRHKAPHVQGVEILTAELRVQEPYENYK
ncbi:PIN domain-containing protein [Rhizobium leguminosarum]|uniref:PIN domain-containing protein n=1 Tax=Rhizobium leguminosarum TaxID=384 RepID=UPI003F9A2D38